MPQPSPSSIALIVVDVQKGLDDTTHWGPRNNPDCEKNISILINAWRELAAPTSW
jgi:nicotinamidase-related amidase